MKNIITENITPKITLYNCDCMDFMKNVPDKYYDLAIVDPPYGIRVNMNAGRKKDTKSKKRTIKKWDNNTPTQKYFNELFRISKNQIIWGANYFIDKINKNSRGWIFWDKCVASKCSFSDGELAFTSFDVILKKAVIPYSGFIGMEEEKFHPTTKPVKLYEWLLKNYAKPTDKIIDTHFGSCSIGIACHNFGCSLDACEIDKEYFDKALERLRRNFKELDLFR